MNGPRAVRRWGFAGRWRREVLVLVGFAALTGIMTWPLLRHFRSAVLGPPGDNLEYVWKMWWFKQALLDLRISPLFNPNVFFPFGYPLALSETTMTHTLLGLPITALFGEVVAYNTVVFCSFVWSGYGLYLLCRQLGCGRMASFLSGVAFSFCPYRLAHLGAGHLPLLGTGWMPILLLGLERSIQRPNWRSGLLAGVGYALTALSSWYYAVMMGVFGGLYLLLRARPWRRSLWRLALWRDLGLAAIVAMLLVAPAALPLFRAYGQGEASYGYSLAYVDQWSASPIDFVYPNAMHPWWGRALIQGYTQNIQENLVYLGIVPVTLAFIGFWSRRRKRQTKAVAALVVLALILALGTTLHFGGKPIYLRVPEAVEYQFSRAMYVLTSRWALHKVDYSSLRRPGAIVLPLPTLLLYLFVPAVDAMRVWARFGVLAMMGVAVLAGWGLEALLARIGARRALRRLLSVVATGALLMEFAVLPYPFGHTVVKGQPIDYWLAQQAPGSALIHYPLEKTWYGWMLYPTRVHDQPIAYGYGTFVPRAYREASATLTDWPSAGTLALLKDWGVRYVLLGARSYGERWPAVREAMTELPTVRQVAVLTDEPIYFGDRLLHLVPPSADVPATELVSGDRQAYLSDEIHVYEIE